MDVWDGLNHVNENDDHTNEHVANLRIGMHILQQIYKVKTVCSILFVQQAVINMKEHVNKKIWPKKRDIFRTSFLAYSTRTKSNHYTLQYLIFDLIE